MFERLLKGKGKGRQYTKINIQLSTCISVQFDYIKSATK